MRIFRFFLMISLLWNTAGVSKGQQVEFSHSADKISIMETLTLTVKVTGQPGGFQPQFPSINGMFAGPVGRGEMPGGKGLVFMRTYFPTAAGKMKVPAYTYQGATKSFTSQPFEVIVEFPGMGSGMPDLQALMDDFMKQFGDSEIEDFFGSKRQAPRSVPRVGKDSYFLVTNLDKKECYVGEQVLCKIDLYLRRDQASMLGVYLMGMRSLQSRMNNLGFWQEVIDLDYLQPDRVEVGGKEYLVYTIYQTILFPLQEGNVELRDVFLEILQFPRPTLSDPVQALQYGPGQNGGQVVKAYAETVGLNVLPLPKTLKPHSGAVGSDFTIRAELAANKYKTGEPLQLKIKIEGRGNLASAKAPLVKTPESFVAEIPTADYSISKSAAGYKGKREFTFTWTPLEPGEYFLGPVMFYYFRPEKAWYDSLVVDSLPVTVTGNSISREALQDTTGEIFYEHAFSNAQDRRQSHIPAEKPLLLSTVALIAGALAWRRWRTRSAKKNFRN